jgi:hypothetical protein
MFHIMFQRQTNITTPGKHTALIEQIPNQGEDQIGEIIKTVQGLLIHDDSLELYGLTKADFPNTSRETLSLATRIDQILSQSSAPLTTNRAPKARQIATCRDYAVMTCGILRHKNIPARLRCGFASYFTPNQYEDHWICEYWDTDQTRWIMIDAQLDQAHIEHLNINFDALDVPDTSFITSAKAWKSVKSNDVDANLYGHSEAHGQRFSGGWFIWLNLARDYFALKSTETSPWDNWRTEKNNRPDLGIAGATACSEFARHIEGLEIGEPLSGSVPKLVPYWEEDAGPKLLF